jgi:hypothetical protein
LRLWEFRKMFWIVPRWYLSNKAMLLRLFYIRLRCT